MAATDPTRGGGATTVARCGDCGASPRTAAPADAVAPGTHCEWCGAEYEVPSAAPGDDPGARGALGPVACCIDTSEAARAAIAAAVAVRARAPGRLALVHVAPPEAVLLGGLTPWEIDDDDPRRPVREWLAGWVARTPGAEPVLLTGAAPGETIAGWAGASGADLVVVAGHGGRLERALLGSEARTLAERSPCDVLIVRGAMPAPAGRIACCVNDSAGSAPAVAAARRYAGLLGCEVTLVHAVAPPDLMVGTPTPRAAAAAARMLAAHAGEDREWDRVTLAGAPAPAVRAWAEESGVDLIVVGPGSDAAVGLGSFARAMATASPRPVLIARAHPG